MTNGFDLGHDLDLWIFKAKCDFDLWPHAWPWPRIFMVKFWNSCTSEWEGRLTLNKGDESWSFMTMTETNWWPRSCVRIYQIVTRVTSDVGVLSTHRVLHGFLTDHAGESLRFLATDWLRNGSWALGNGILTARDLFFQSKTCNLRHNA